MRTYLLHCLLVLIGVLTPSLCRAAAATWADDPAAYLSSPAGRHATIGRSHGPCLSAAEAQGQAIDDAARQLVDARLGASRTIHRDALVRSMRATLIQGRFVRDRSVTSVRKPYGELWSAAVLVDAPPADLSREMARWAMQRDVERQGRVGGTAGIILVVALAYLLANAVTRGYFRGRLRCLAVLGCAIPTVLIWVAR